MPSVIQAAEEVSHFHSMGHINFTDEVSFGYVLSRVYKTHNPYFDEELPEVNTIAIRKIIDQAQDGFLSADTVFQLLEAAGINTVKQAAIKTEDEVIEAAKQFGFPLVMKVSGPLHKSDLGGVALGINSLDDVKKTFHNLMQIEGADGVILQQQLSGTEIYVGAKAEEKFGHQILVGLGGIFVEVFKDISSGLAPIGKVEAQVMLQRLKSYPIIKGTRGKEGVNENLIIQTLAKISALVAAAPEISEMDLNPLLGNSKQLVAVDARICITK